MTQPPTTDEPMPPQGEKQDGFPVPRFLFPPRYYWLLGAISLCFLKPLSDLAVFALNSDLYSHAILIPLITAFLIYDRRKGVPLNGRPSKEMGLCIGLISLGLVGYFFQSTAMEEQNYLSIIILAYVCLILSASCFCLSIKTITYLSFPFLYLVFLIPFPLAWENAIQVFFQHTSAEPAYWLFQIAGTPVFRQDLVFNLSTIALQVAPECSGIHSSLVLFMVSLVAGNLFLKKTWKRIFIVVFVIPLAIVRNGFRVFVLGELCVHIGPEMIDSPIHHHGGPLFFGLSLGPFFLVLYILWRSERKRSSPSKLISK